jgi:hypothetical protein
LGIEERGIAVLILSGREAVDERPREQPREQSLSSGKMDWKVLARAHRTQLGCESAWAYLPVGPLERQFRKGDQGGFWEEVRKNPRERVLRFFGGTSWGSLC